MVSAFNDTWARKKKVTGTRGRPPAFGDAVAEFDASATKQRFHHPGHPRAGA